jgi:hypothetical protein
MYPKKFFRYFRMSSSSFDEGLFVIRPNNSLSKYHNQDICAPEECLPVSLR